MKKMIWLATLLAACSPNPSQAEAVPAEDTAKTQKLLRNMRDLIGPRYARGGVYRGGGGISFDISWRAYCKHNKGRGLNDPFRDVPDALQRIVGLYHSKTGGSGSQCGEDFWKIADDRSTYERYPTGQPYLLAVEYDEKLFLQRASEWRSAGKGYLTYIKPEERCLIRLMIGEKRRIQSVTVIMREESEGSFSIFDRYHRACIGRSLLIGNGLMRGFDMSVDEINSSRSLLPGRRSVGPADERLFLMALYFSTPIPFGASLDQAMKLIAARPDLPRFYPPPPVAEPTGPPPPVVIQDLSKSCTSRDQAGLDPFAQQRLRWICRLYGMPLSVE